MTPAMTWPAQNQPQRCVAAVKVTEAIPGQARTSYFDTHGPSPQTLLTDSAVETRPWRYQEDDGREARVVPMTAGAPWGS